MLNLLVLKEEKKKQNISYQELEKITGVSKTDICKICNNQCVTVNLKKVDLIRAALGLKRTDLLIQEKVEEYQNKIEVMKGQMHF